MSRPKHAGARLLAAILPVAGLAGLWATSDRAYNAGTEWEVPIQGYDPRDYLRGHYVEFGYDWPGIDEFGNLPLEALCLEGDSPSLRRVTPVPADAPCRGGRVRADGSGVYGWESLTRGRLYIGQDRAARLEQELRNRDQRGIVTIRQREDGSFTPVAIRFRALTPAEVAERDAGNGRAEDTRPPPAIMSR